MMGFHLCCAPPAEVINAKAAIVVSALGPASMGETEGQNRLAIRNDIFPENPVDVSTSLLDHLLQVFSTYRRDDKVDRFSFEVAVHFIDMPEALHSFVTAFPLPLSVAICSAHSVLLRHIEEQTPVQMQQTITAIFPELSPQQKKVFTTLLRNLAAKNYRNLGPLLEPFRETVDLCTGVLSLLPGYLHMHLALKFLLPTPRIEIDLANVLMPLEFLQAVADIRGIEFAASLVLPLRPVEPESGAV
jgi:hypothetical protein